MGGHNTQTKKARQQGPNQLTKTASATLTSAEVLAYPTILAESATAMTLGMPATDTALAGVFGVIGNAGAGVATISYTAQSGVKTVTLDQDDSVSYNYDQEGKCYLDTANSGAEIVVADPGDEGVLPLEGSVTLVTAAAETRTLAIPGKIGAMLSLTLDDDGGDCVITVASAINTTGNNTLTLDTEGGNIVLIAASVSQALAWRVVANDAVTLSTV
jgi:hypothetical protein